MNPSDIHSEDDSNSISIMDTRNQKTNPSQKSFSVLENNQLSSKKSHSVIGNLSLDQSAYNDEEEKKEDVESMKNSSKTDYSDDIITIKAIKPKIIVILYQEIEKIMSNKASKLAMKVTKENELIITMKERSQALVDSFKHMKQRLEDKLNECKHKIILHSKPINELKTFIESSNVKDLNKKFKDVQFMKFSDFRTICEKLNQKFEYPNAIDYYKKKSNQKPRFCLLTCQKADFDKIQAFLLKNMNSSNNNNGSINSEKIEVIFPIEAKIDENLIKDLLKNQLNDHDFQVKLWLSDEKLTLEVVRITHSVRKLKEEIEVILKDFNKNAVFMIEIKEISYFYLLESLFTNDLPTKIREYGIKFKLLSTKLPKGIDRNDHRTIYDYSKKHIEREFVLNNQLSNKEIIYFLAVKGNRKVLDENKKKYEDFIQSFHKKTMKIPIEIPIINENTLKDFSKYYSIKEEIIMICKNNLLVSDQSEIAIYKKKALLANDENEIFIEIPIIIVDKDWPMYNNQAKSIDNKMKEREKATLMDITRYFESYAFKTIEMNINQIDDILNKPENSKSKINNFKLFVKKFALFHEPISQNKLLIIAKNKENIENALTFIESINGAIETHEISIENPLLLSYFANKNNNINISNTVRLELDIKALKLIISSPKASLASDITKTNEFIKGLLDKIMIKELKLDIISLKEFNREKLDTIEQKYQCIIEKFPAISDNLAINNEKTIENKQEIIIKLGFQKEKTLHIIQGDIFQNPNELLVIPVDANLLFNGGIAKEIRQILAQNLDNFIKNILKERSKSFETGDCIYCDMKGKFFKNLMFVIGPIYEGDAKIEKNRKEYKVFINKIFELANSKGNRYITMPLIGAGNNQFPMKEVSKMLVQYSIDYINNHINTVKEIYIIEKDYEKFNALNNEIQYISANKAKGAASISTIKKTIGQWSWHFFEKADDYFELYDSEINEILEKSYEQKLDLCDISGYIAVSYPIPSHSFDFNNYLCTHLRLSTSKRFYRKKQGVWAVDEGNQKECVFTNKICEILENFYEKGDFKAPLNIFINNYQVHLKEIKDVKGNGYFVQENIETGFTRKVIRNQKIVNFQDSDMLNLDISIENEVHNPRYNMPIYEESGNTMTSSNNDNKGKFVGLKVKGLDSIMFNKCVDELQDEMNHMLQTKEFHSNKEIEADSENITTLGQSLKISIYLLTEEKIVCKGLVRNLNKFRDYIQVKYYNDEEIYPEIWERCEEFHLSELEKTSYEFEAITKSFKETMEKPTKISKITRIENQKLYLKYMLEKRNLLEKYENFDIPEDNLYYKLEDPNILDNLIQNEGIKLSNSAKNGILGYGIYLSSQAKAFHQRGLLVKKNEKHKMIVCRTLIGIVQRTKEAKKDRNKLDLIENQILKTYDSLEYISPQGIIMVIFNDNRIYPEFIVEYSF